MIPTRSAALAALKNFVPSAGALYAKGRNYCPAPGEKGAESRLSPYLQRRLLLETEVLEAVTQQHSFEDSEKFIQEVLWRTYWKGWLEQRPGVWKSFRESRGSSPGSKYALEGRTGIECFDQWVEELRSTGFLHNHARMWFASIWIFSLKLPWQEGANFFLQELLDADAASNTLGWRWVAGLQTRGKHYLATSQNIAAFTRGRFAHTKYLAEGASCVPWDSLADAPLAALPANSPSGLRGKKLGLILHPEDLTLEHSDLAGLPVARVLVLDPAWWPRVERSLEFERAALEDEGSRLERHFNAKIDWAKAQDAGLPEEVTRWQKENCLDEVVAMRPFVGPWQELLSSVRSLSFDRRPHDQRLFPHAKKGFFHFRTEIPAYMKSLR